MTRLNSEFVDRPFFFSFLFTWGIIEYFGKHFKSVSAKIVQETKLFFVRIFPGNYYTYRVENIYNNSWVFFQGVVLAVLRGAVLYAQLPGRLFSPKVINKKYRGFLPYAIFGTLEKVALAKNRISRIFILCTQ